MKPEEEYCLEKLQICETDVDTISACGRIMEHASEIDDPLLWEVAGHLREYAIESYQDENMNY